MILRKDPRNYSSQLAKSFDITEKSPGESFEPNSPIKMSPLKCCLCFQPSTEFPEYFKSILRDFTQVFNNTQSFPLQPINVDNLPLCRSCWICVMKVHQFDHERRLKKETCDVKKTFLAFKIHGAQRLLAESGHNLDSCEDFDLHSSTSYDNEKDLELIGTTQYGENQPQPANEDRNPTTCNSPFATIEDNPQCSPQSPCRMSLKSTADSETESIKLYEVTDVITSATDSLSITASSAEEEPVEAVSVDTNESHNESETAKSKTLVDSVSTSSSLQDKEPAESASDDVSESSDSEYEPDKSEEDPAEVMPGNTSDSHTDSESEPVKTRRVTSRSKRLPKNTKRSSGWRIRASNVKRLSDTDFTYLQKYPFQKTDLGFKCGLCSAVSNFYNGSSRTEYNILKHIHSWHINSNRTRSNKIKQRFIEIAPNRFQYGNYKVELIDGNYRCEECGELRAPNTRGRKSAYAKIVHHIIRHHENPSRTYVCEHCGNVYRTSWCLSEHKTTKHGNPDHRFPCSECGKTFPSRFSTSMHQKQVHGTKKKFICEICGKECSQKQALKRHIAFVHDGQMIKCDLCDKMFGSKLALSIHRHCHLGTKFVCDICGMDFSQQCSIKRHKRTAHNQ